jgi:hypothetical protein
MWHMQFRWVLVATASVAALSCTFDKLPTAATPIAAPSPPLPTPPLPTTVPGVLSIGMPVDSADVANTAFGMLPFGYHGGGHTEGGHAGWDIEYRLGAPVRAAAGGTVLSVEPDPDTPDRFIVVLEHVVGTHFYRTHYANLVNVGSGVVEDALVLERQTIGTAGAITATIGGSTITYAMTHFQLDDLEFHREVANPKAVSPEPFLNAEGKALFDRVWSTATYFQELVEPFATNARETTVTTRTWMRAGGDGPAGIRFTRQGSTYTYELLAESGTVIEVGTVSLAVTSRPSTVDLVSPTATRLGSYDIISNELHLTLANPGSSRPASVTGANVYRTNR